MNQANEDFTVECIRCGKKEFSATQMPKNWVCPNCYAEEMAGF